MCLLVWTQPTNQFVLELEIFNEQLKVEVTICNNWKLKYIFLESAVKNYCQCSNQTYSFRGSTYICIEDFHSYELLVNIIN